jgi:two-component system chemotaxis response regulator CheB
VIGVVLSGNLDDGSAGALAIHAAGGTVVVQDPGDAMYPGMPSNALAAVPSATVLPLDRIAAQLVRSITSQETADLETFVGRSGAGPALAPADPADPVELGVAQSESFSKRGVASGLTCPECHGGIFELDAETGGAPQYRCRVGHAFSAETLLAEQKASLEVALWTAVRALEEAAELARRMEQRSRTWADGGASAMYHREAHLFDARARTVRDVLRSGVPVFEPDPGASGAST